MIRELGKASILIFLAEMGDKTQLLAMAFALQYSLRQVLSGVALGAFLNHGLAVLLGVYLSRLIPLSSIRLGASFLFLAFGLWTLFSSEDKNLHRTGKVANPVLLVAAAFFLGELGDKTQLTAIALACDARFPVAILAGTVLGMVLTSFVAVVVGVSLGERVPEFVLKLVSGGVFIGFGLFGLIKAVPASFLPGKTLMVLIALLIVLGFVFSSFRYRRMQSKQGQLTRIAGGLKALEAAICDLCLGEEKCGECRRNRCPVGYCRALVKQALWDQVQKGELSARVQPYRKRNQHFPQTKVEKVLSLLGKSGLEPKIKAQLRANLEKLRS